MSVDFGLLSCYAIGLSICSLKISVKARKGEKMENLGEDIEPADFTEKQIDVMISQAWNGEDIAQIDEDIEAARPSTEQAGTERAGREIVRKLGYIPVSLITNNIKQPRFILFESQEEFDEMARSIQTHGNVKRPIIVIPFNKGFMLKDGQRRLEAARSAGIKKIFSIIEYVIDQNGRPLPVSPVELLEDAVITNLHQRKMNSIEEAMAYIDWMELTGKNQSELAARMGKKNSDISNLLKLLKLDADIQMGLISGQIPKVLGQHLASWPKEKQKELARVYDEILVGLNGKIPSTNISQWTAKTLRKVAEQKGIKPLKPKKGPSLKSFSEMVVVSKTRAIGRFRSNLDELEEIDRKDLLARKEKFSRLISDLRLLSEEIEDACVRLEGRLGI